MLPAAGEQDQADAAQHHDEDADPLGGGKPEQEPADAVVAEVLKDEADDAVADAVQAGDEHARLFTEGFFINKHQHREQNEVQQRFQQLYGNSGTPVGAPPTGFV